MQKLLQQLREAEERLNRIAARLIEANDLADELKKKLDDLDADKIVGLVAEVSPPENR